MNTKTMTSYEQITLELKQSGVPKCFFDDLPSIVEEFEEKHIGLLDSDKRAFHILLLGAVYKKGYNSGKAAD